MNDLTLIEYRCENCGRVEVLDSLQAFQALNNNADGENNPSWKNVFRIDQRFPKWMMLCLMCNQIIEKEFSEKIANGTSHPKMTKETIPPSPLSVVELCRMMCELPPDEWIEEVLWPMYKSPVSISGHNQVAMERENLYLYLMH